MRALLKRQGVCGFIPENNEISGHLYYLLSEYPGNEPPGHILHVLLVLTPELLQ
jgi:hypothetical protein